MDQGSESFFIDKISGKLATENTPKETLEEIVVTNVHTILYWVDKNDILGPPPENPARDPQFSHWEVPVQNWWTQNKGKYQITTINQKPQQEDDVHTDTSRVKVSILEPNDKAIYDGVEKIEIKVQNQGPFPLKKMDVFVNDLYLGSTDESLKFAFIPDELDSLKKENELRIIFYDTIYNRGEVITSFEVK